jgi:hypothetical protein
MNDLKMTNAGDYMTYAENTTVYFNPENITYPVSAHSVSARSVLHTPKPVGAWIIGETLQIAVTHRVTDEQIKNTEEMFGWKWVDYENN